MHETKINVKHIYDETGPDPIQNLRLLPNADKADRSIAIYKRQQLEFTIKLVRFIFITGSPYDIFCEANYNKMLANKMLIASSDCKFSRSVNLSYKLKKLRKINWVKTYQEPLTCY